MVKALVEAGVVSSFLSVSIVVKGIRTVGDMEDDVGTSLEREVKVGKVGGMVSIANCVVD